MKFLVSWFVHHGVAPNLLMLLIVIGGLATVPRLRQEIFPEFSSDTITISVAYLGASPEEVEEGVCVRVEEAVQGLPGIKRIRSTALEGTGTVTIEVLEDADIRHLLDEVKARVETIETFPEETEKPVVQEVLMRRQVIDLAVHGNTDEATLRKAAERVRDEVVAIDGISVVELSNARGYEISIEVSETALRRYGLTFDEVASAVRKSSLDRPGGSVDTRGGEILVRTKGQKYRGEEFENISVRAFPDGTRILLSDIANIIDGFEETDQSTRFDGERTILVSVYRVGEQSALEISEKVHDYVLTAQTLLPEGIHVTAWQDGAVILRGRLDLLIRNGYFGLALVFVSLSLFLKLRLAFWVALGIPISFLGAIWMLPSLDLSVNVISLFAFIVVLGIVVDDAIIVGENIYTHQQRGGVSFDSAIRGTLQVGRPVTFAVLTTIAAFSPLLNVPGRMGKVMGVVPLIVIATLVFSLIESLFILPRHLCRVPREGSSRPNPLVRGWTVVQDTIDGLQRWFIERVYRPLLSACLRRRVLTLAVGMSFLLVTVGMLVGGRIKFVFFPPVDADTIVAYVTLPQGSAVEITEAAVRRLEESAREVRDELNGDAETNVFDHMQASIGGQPYRETQSVRAGQRSSFSGSHLGEVAIELRRSEERSISSTEIARLWRQRTGAIADAVEVSYSASLFSSGEPVNVQLSSANPGSLQQASSWLKAKLRRTEGVEDITDSYRSGKRELKLGIRRDVEHLGLTHADLAHQVRQGFYGEEVQRILRGRDEVKVMLRYPRSERMSLGDIESSRVRTPDGTEVPFLSVATVASGRGFSTINRTDRRRVINVKADVDQAVANPNEINAELRSTILPELRRKFVDVDYSLEGEQREQLDTMLGLGRGFIVALVLIYMLLGVAFRSYSQPLIIMGSIPFGIVGAVWGHVLLGLELTLLSSFGIVALTGVIVNDSLVMVDFINRKHADGVPVLEAIRESGVARFRAILLTSLTTFAGLTPLLLERSMQARFLIPMAVSLGFGVLFATLITLLLVPVSYAVLKDVGRLYRRVTGAPEDNPMPPLSQ